MKPNRRWCKDGSIRRTDRPTKQSLLAEVRELERIIVSAFESVEDALVSVQVKRGREVKGARRTKAFKLLSTAYDELGKIALRPIEVH